MTTEARMIALGFRKYARADRIFALEPLLGEERGDGRRTKVWVEGVADPIIASRTKRAILRDMGQEAAADASLVDEASTSPHGWLRPPGGTRGSERFAPRSPPTACRHHRARIG